MARTEIVHDDACLRLGVCRNLVVNAWLESPTGIHAKAMGKAILDTATRSRMNFGVLNAIVAGTPRFTDDFRDEIVKVLRDPRVQGSGSAHIVTLGGFGGVAVRAFLSTVLLLGRSASPNKVFSDPRAAAVWLAPLLSTGGERWTSEEILTAYAEVARVPVTKAG